MTAVKALWSLLFVFSAQPALASTELLTLNFDAAIPSYDDGASLDLGLATITVVDGEKLFLYGTDDFGMPAPGGFCALDVNGDCKADAKIIFDAPVSNLTFYSLYVTNGDGSVLRAVVGGSVEEQFFIKSAGLIDLSDLGGITEISLFDVSGSGDRGIAFGGFSFTEYTPVPLPAGFPLLLTALILFGFGHNRLAARGKRA